MKRQSLRLLLILIAFIGYNCQSKTSNKTVEEGAQIIDEHNAKNSLDWEGTYRGVLPCADCEGIATTITLNKDMSYLTQSRYLGKDESTFEEKGTFTWNEAGNTVALSGKKDASNLYFVGENQLFHLDRDGNRITGALAENYILKKIVGPALLTEAFWVLKTLEEKPVKRKSNFKDKEIHIAFNNDENRISGFAGCNSFGGFYEITGEGTDGNSLTFSKVFSTQMACPDLDIESALFNVLENTKTYRIEKEVLLFQDSEKATLAEFEAVFK